MLSNNPMNGRNPVMYATRANRCATFVLAAGLSLLPSLLQAQITVPANRRSNGGLRPPAEKELIYVTLPGTLEGSWDQNGNGIVVLDEIGRASCRERG